MWWYETRMVMVLWWWKSGNGDDTYRQQDRSRGTRSPMMKSKKLNSSRWHRREKKEKRGDGKHLWSSPVEITNDASGTKQWQRSSIVG